MSAPRSTPLHVPVTSWAPRAPTPHPCRWEHAEPLAHGRAHGSRHGERGGRTAVPLRACKCACERGPRAAGGGPHGGDSPAPGCLLWPGPTVAEPGTGARSPALRSGAGGTLTRHRLGFPERDLHPAPALLRPRQTELGGPGWGRGGGNGDEDGAAGSSQAGSWGAGPQERGDEDEDEGERLVDVDVRDWVVAGMLGRGGITAVAPTWPCGSGHSPGLLGVTAAGSPARCSRSPSPVTARHWVGKGSAPAQAAATQSRARQGGGGRRRAGPAQLDPSDVERKSPRVSKPALEWGQDAPGPRKQSTERLRGRPHGQVES